MPMTWTAPEVFFEHRGVIVYHAYKNQDLGNRLSSWFSWDVNESDDSLFTPRELSVVDDPLWAPKDYAQSVDHEYVKTFLRAAIDRGLDFGGDRPWEAWQEVTAHAV